LTVQALTVGVGDCKITADPGVELITYALGSCIAVAVWDPVARVAGLLHFLLPDSGIDRTSGGRDTPFRYADTGTPLLFRGAYDRGAEKRRMVVRIAGGAAVFDDGGIFNIGQRNLAALRKILWKAGVLVQAEDVGGSVSRTVRLNNADGKFMIRCAGEQERELAGRKCLDRGGVPCTSA
jgi:chemotaxis protein CheD